ncbi:MAG: ABC transporter permease [Clostridia bacterium]|nr:ABC transporter permease [Clostridia bacterium]
MLAIYKRELRSYFVSPIGYIFVAIFLIASGLLFSYCTLQAGSGSSVSTYFSTLMYMFIIVLPLLTMKLFSDEKKMRTEQLLLTSPVSLMGMVVAKFLAAYTVFAATFLISCLDFLLLYQFGTPNSAILLGSSLAILLAGAACIAVGVFISALTENQLISALGTMAILVFFVLTSILNGYIDNAVIRSVINWVSIMERFVNFTSGIFDFNAIVYYLSLSFVFLFLTVRVYDKRRWN